MSNCPIGTESNKDAPWNEKENIDRKVDVTVSITLSKTLTILVNDYTIDEEGNIDFSDCDLRSAVEKQIILPQNAAKYVSKKLIDSYEVADSLSNWNIDDYEIVLG